MYPVGLQWAAYVIVIGMVIGAAIAIGKVFLAASRTFERVQEFFDDWNGDPPRPGVPGRPGVMSRIEAMEEKVDKVVAEVEALNVDHSSGA